MYQIWLFDDIPNMYEIAGAILVIIACAMSVLEEVYNHYNGDDESYDYYESVSDGSDVEDP